MAQYDVVAIIGSLRKESFTRRIVLALTGIAPASLRIEIVEIGQLPLYNQDLDSSVPEWHAFRERVGKADAVLFATPEHNRSVPAALKNAVDIASRPYGQSKWNGKPAAVLSCSPGGIAGFGANHHLRQSLVFLNMPVLQQPELYLGGADKLVDGEGRFANPGTQEFLAGFLGTFAAWIERNAPKSAG